LSLYYGAKAWCAQETKGGGGLTTHKALQNSVVCFETQYPNMHPFGNVNNNSYIVYDIYTWHIKKRGGADDKSQISVRKINN